MNKEFLESLAKCLEKFISNEVEKRCKKLEDEKNAAELNSQRYKGWLLFLIKDNSINLDKLYEEAEKITGISHSNIVAVCNGRRKTAGGFIWKYELDVERLIPME